MAGNIEPNVEWDTIDEAGHGSKDIIVGDGGFEGTPRTPFGLPGNSGNFPYYCGVNWTLKWKISKSRKLYIRLERKEGADKSIYNIKRMGMATNNKDIVAATYAPLILRATVFPGTFKKAPDTFWRYESKKLVYHSENTEFGTNRGDTWFFDNATVIVNADWSNSGYDFGYFTLTDVVNPPGNGVLNQQKVNGKDFGIYVYTFNSVPNSEVSIAISGTAGYEVDDPAYPVPYIVNIEGVKEVVEQILDYFPCSRYFNNDYQSCNRSGGSFQTWHSGAWQDRKNVANNSSKSTTFYYSNGWQIAPKTGANAK